VLRGSLADEGELGKKSLQLRPAASAAATGCAHRCDIVDGRRAGAHRGVDRAVTDRSTATHHHASSPRLGV